MTIGEQLDEAADAILALIRKTPDVDQKKALRDKLNVVLAETERLLKLNVDAATPEYQKATAGLTQANRAIADAMTDVAKVAQAIQQLAKAIDLAAELGKMAAV